MSEDKELTEQEKAEQAREKASANGHAKTGADDVSVPEYEVTEEGEQEQEATAPKENEEEDTRPGKRRDGNRYLSNREKRQLRKQKIAQKFDAKDNLIRQQQEQLNTLAHQLNEFGGRLSQVDQNTLQQTYNDSVKAFQSADQKYKEAFQNGDGEKASVALREMYAAQKAIDECEVINARMQAQPQRQAAARPAKDPITTANAMSWAERNPWFVPVGGNEESAITDSIAARMKQEGFDFRKADDWDELDERLAKRGIGHDADDEEDQQEQSQSQRERQTPQRGERRRSPPVSGGGNRGDLGNGKVRVALPTAFIKNMKEAGIWDDPVRRNRAIRDYERIRAERN